jgi:hypothetical protein
LSKIEENCDNNQGSDNNQLQIQPFHKGLAMQADVAFCFIPGA